MIFVLYFVLLSFGIVEGASIIQECIWSNGIDYRGNHEIASNGHKCLNWVNTRSDVGNHSFCRNPDGSDKPWCYVMNENGTVQRHDCDIIMCTDSGGSERENTVSSSPGDVELFEPAQSIPVQSDDAAVQPVIGISQRVQTGPKKKKDLGTLGYVLGIVMMAIIILLGVGITFGYFYKRGLDLKRHHEQRVYEREMQRITLPLSAFSNPACELAEENAVVVVADGQTPCQEGETAEGGTPLMGVAGTPGA